MTRGLPGEVRRLPECVLPEVEKSWGEKEKTAAASNPRATQGLDPVTWAREGSALPKVMDSRLRLRVTAWAFTSGLRVSYRP